jgi:hypothetical protein
MPNDQPATQGGRRRCFVVMGFGIKTDFAIGRKLDLDKSYQLLIKPVVEEAGLECVRADEIRHSGVIDVPMYRELLTAGVVVADLSTANPNALYELGIRHALRPRTTIVISENKLPYPFDINHILITSYTRLGDDIGYSEVMRFRKVLGDNLRAVLKSTNPDSPVYTYLSQLTPPALAKALTQAEAKAGEAAAKSIAFSTEAVAGQQPRDQGPPDRTLAALVQEGERAIREGRFTDAKHAFTLALKLSQAGPADGPHRQDPYLIQRLFLATYKAEQPDPVTALNEALAGLAPLDLENSNDPEAVSLAGAIEKRLFDRGQGAEHLGRAIKYYERGYYLRNDYYNGINLAYLLTLRADTPLDGSGQEKVADLVWANRIRREVVTLCDAELQKLRERQSRSSVPTSDPLWKEQADRDRDQTFWCLATKAEADFGLGDHENYERAKAEISKLQPAAWMTASFEGQLGRLKVLLEKHGHLLDPPWAAPPPRSAEGHGAT